MNQYTKTKKTKCLTATPEETLDVMIRLHFTGDCEDVAAEQNNAQETSKTPTIKQPTELTNKIINEDRLEKVIKALEPLKAAGPDNVQNVLIQNAYKNIKTPYSDYTNNHIIQDIYQNLGEKPRVFSYQNQVK